MEDSLKQAIQYDEGKDRLKDSNLSFRWTAETVYRKNSSDETLMDEPTSALDPIATTKIEELIYILKKGLHDNNCYSQYAASYQNL